MIRRLAASVTAGTLLIFAACSGDSDGDSDDDAKEPVAGAELIAGGGEQSPEAIKPGADDEPDEPELVAVDDDVSDLTLTDLDLSEATEVVADVDGGYWILASGVAFHVDGDRVDLAVTGPAMEHLAADPAGGVAVADRSTVWALAQGEAIHTFTPGFDEIGAIAVGNDGTVFAGNRDNSEIDAWAPDQPTRHVLGTGTDAETVTEDIGGIISLVPLDDGRVAFVNLKGERVVGGTFQLHLLDGSAMKLVEANTYEVDPETESAAVPFMTIGPGPEGQAVAVEESRIKLIDLASENATVLVELEGDHLPRSAAIDGTDLLFLARGRLWREPDVIG